MYIEIIENRGIFMKRVCLLLVVIFLLSSMTAFSAETLDIGSFDVSYAKTITYGDSLPTPKVYDESRILKQGKDYRVSYQNTDAVGSASIIIVGRGMCYGELACIFKILPKPTRIVSSSETADSITIKWRAQPEQIDGYQIRYSLNKNFDDQKVVTISSKTVVRKTVKKIARGKRHYFSIRTYKKVLGFKYYSSWSSYYKTDGFIDVSSPNKRLAIKVKHGCIYGRPTKNSSKIKRLSFGKKVVPKKKRGSWYFVQYTHDKKVWSGYVRRADVVVYDKTKKHIALTFDDGPNYKTTKIVLAALKKYRYKATFFVVGSRINTDNVSMLKQEKALGCEIGNHTYNHPFLTSLSKTSVKSQFFNTDKRVKKYTKKKPTLCRAPYGATNKAVSEIMHRPNIYWSVDTLDWKYRNTSKLVSKVKKSKKDGAIVLMHDIHMSTAKAIKPICRDLNQSGYEAVTVTELAAIKGKKIVTGKTYFSF